jgi:putative component of toxin-antitoxin plasmid stabilization module
MVYDIEEHSEFSGWVKDLRDLSARAKIVARVNQVRN